MTAAGPDLPPPDQPFTGDVYEHRWPTGAEKVELKYGCPYFYGRFDHRDAATAERAFPGRRAVIVPWNSSTMGYGNLLILPADPAVVDRLVTRYAKALDDYPDPSGQTLSVDRYRQVLEGTA
jgi:hypothetical protein